jgi:outer membrane protein assembly factor BamB
MYRTGDDEVVVALDAETGKTIWEHKYGAPVYPGMETQFGRGPNSTPAIHEGRIYTIGVAGHLHCLDAKAGARIWSHDLMNEFTLKMPEFGYSSSPLNYKDTLIVLGGGEGRGVLAFDLKSGSSLWKKHDFVNTYSSPILIQVGGEDQIVILGDRAVVGISPSTGDLRWSFPHENQWKTNVCTPIWGDDRLLYVTSGGEAGSRALRFEKNDRQTKVEEVWATGKMAVGHGNAVRVGDMVYGSTGGEGPSFLTAVGAKTGKIAWRERGFSNATLLSADGKLILLDEDGNLALATGNEKELRVHSKVQLLKKSAWTAPTLVGKRLYLRDNETIMALDLG